MVGPERIDGWKAIAVYFGRDRTTMLRWARERGLPVRRMPGGKHATVYALRSELEAWALTHDSANDDAPRPKGDNAAIVSPTSAVGSPPRNTKSARQPWKSPAAIVAAFAGTLVVALGCYWLVRSQPADIDPKRIAFFGIEAPASDATAQAAAAATSSDILAAFAAMEQDVAAAADTEGVPARGRLERARTLHAAYAVSGTITSNSDGLSMTVLVEDTKTRTALWSDPFQGRTPATLVSHAAGLLNDKLNCVMSARANLHTDDLRIISLLPKACQSLRGTESGAVERWQEIARLAPSSPWVLAHEAEALYNAAPEAPKANFDELVRRADASLKRALELDPSSPDALRTRIAWVRAHGGSIADVDDAFVYALKRAPRGPNLSGGYSAFLLSVGRLQEAARYGRLALGSDPLSLPKLMGIGELLVHAGFPGDGSGYYDKSHAMFPSSLEWQTRVMDALFKSAGSLKDVVGDPPADVSPETRACIDRLVGLAGQQAPASRSAAVKEVRRCRDSGALNLRKALEAEAFLGDYDETLAVTPDPSWYSGEAANLTRHFLYDPLLAPMRMDNRFTLMAERSGLLTYWSSGHPPDFCVNGEKAPVCAMIANVKPPARVASD